MYCDACWEYTGLCPYLVAKHWQGKWTRTAGMLREWVSQSEECHQVAGDWMLLADWLQPVFATWLFDCWTTPKITRTRTQRPSMQMWLVLLFFFCFYFVKEDLLKSMQLIHNTRTTPTGSLLSFQITPTNLHFQQINNSNWRSFNTQTFNFSRLLHPQRSLFYNC